ncbi:MAG: hypothetical protein EZS28_023758 [Streblomastix strix]|uniref:Uncharacterized protein n=1 Tax=Streblomastix strix TaxID=222440 RepID=A0A5J4VE06_9EUKA|nr:MAG: hypothetical protein EZS28_023758 [Streblomastix strix]
MVLKIESPKPVQTSDVWRIYIECYNDELKYMNIDKICRTVTFNNIILMLALAALSSCRISQGHKIGVNATLSSANIYYDEEFQNKKGQVTIDMKGWNDSTYVHHFKKIDDYPVLVQGAKETGAKFLSVANTEEPLYKLKTSVTLTSGELRCDVEKQAFVSGYYSLIGYSAYYQGNADIAPSITHLIKAGVSEVTVKNAPKELTDVPCFNDTVTVQQTCSAGDLDLLTYSKSYNGIVDTFGIPNTVVPDDASKCQTGKMSPVLKGYKTGQVFNADFITIKKLLQRFGAVHLNIEEEGEEQLLPIIVL